MLIRTMCLPSFQLSATIRSIALIGCRSIQLLPENICPTSTWKSKVESSRLKAFANWSGDSDYSPTIHKSKELGFWIVGAVKVALIIFYYFNGTDNPKNPVETRRKKCVVQNMTQLLLLRHLQSLLCTIIHKPIHVISHRH